MLVFPRHLRFENWLPASNLVSQSIIGRSQIDYAFLLPPKSPNQNQGSSVPTSCKRGNGFLKTFLGSGAVVDPQIAIRPSP